MTIFERYVAIDWSGAAGERDRVDLRVAEATSRGVAPRLVPPRHGVRAWRREECRSWLADQLAADRPRTLIALDFAFGLPWGADQAAFGCRGWPALVRTVARGYRTAERARTLARKVNARHRGSGGPFRFDESRNDHRFYVRAGVAYYRLIDALTPQAISPWYLGSGSSVGYHTITGMYALDELIGRRSAGEVDFAVWPQEVWSIDESRHVLVECFPALFRQSGPIGRTARDPHERDALAVARWMADTDRRGNLLGFFALAELPFGRYRGVPFQRQVQFEGWILGVR